MLAFPNCSGFITQEVIYDQASTRIGIEPDPTVKRAPTPVQNDHPAKLSAAQIESLLGMIEVSGWSGTLVGIIAPPRPVPLFSDQDLRRISPYLETAFREAGPTERVFFSVGDPEKPFREDRTAGSLFLRGPYLHLVVTDHLSIVAADTAGGDVKDLRDTKGMKLWVANPAKVAMLPEADEPRWAYFETVHISINQRELLAQRNLTRPSPVSRTSTTPISGDHTPKASAPSSEDLQLQIRELTNSNLDLRDRVHEQNKRMRELSEEIERLSQELEKTKRPPTRKTPLP
jgi:hypothetical protein